MRPANDYYEMRSSFVLFSYSFPPAKCFQVRSDLLGMLPNNSFSWARILVIFGKMLRCWACIWSWNCIMTWFLHKLDAISLHMSPFQPFLSNTQRIVFSITCKCNSNFMCTQSGFRSAWLNSTLKVATNYHRHQI